VAGNSWIAAVLERETTFAKTTRHYLSPIDHGQLLSQVAAGNAIEAGNVQVMSETVVPGL
jgi:hypothetical protein